MATYSWSIPSGQNITGNTYIKDTDDKLGATMIDLVDFVNGEGVYANQGLTFDMVNTYSAQTITGLKTFTNAINANAGVVGNLTGDITGNSATATKLQTPRTINMLGDVTGSVSFDGSSNVNMTASIPDSITEYLVPAGLISMFSGSTAPDGWYLCDGNNNTPDLRNKFIVGSGDTYSNGATGGSADAVNILHSHTATTNAAGEHIHSTNIRTGTSTDGSPDVASGGNPSSYINTDTAGSHSHSVTVNSAGESGVNKNLPPYYALAYIMKG